MATQTPIEIVEAYVALLIMQYLNKERASGTIRILSGPGLIPQVSIQELSFMPPPSSGSFIVSYGGVNSAPISWDDEAADVQTILRAVTGLSDVTVTGSFGSRFQVSFDGVAPPADMLILISSTLQTITTTTEITISEIDTTLPIAVQDAFNLVPGTTLAQGDQLNVLGDYVGVARTGPGFAQTITLDDADYTTLIRMGIFKNSSGSSLATIQNFLYEFFPNQIYVFDYANMSMTYIISQAVGSQDLAQMFVTQGLIPKPMGVSLLVFYVPTANLFSFRTYDHPSVNGSPMNDYNDYNTDWPFLDYRYLVSDGSMIIIIPNDFFFSFRTYASPSNLAPLNDYVGYQSAWPFLTY